MPSRISIVLAALLAATAGLGVQAQESPDMATVQQASPITAPLDARQTVAAGDWRPEAQGEWTTGVRRADFPFDELIYSWSVRLPERQGFRLYLRVGFGPGDESPWLYAGYWGVVELVASRSNPTFEDGVVELDQLLLTREAVDYTFKLVDAGKEPLTVFPALHVILTDNPEGASARPARNASDWPILDLPLRRQVSSTGEPMPDRCQSAALATALEYYGTSVPIEQIVELTNDPEYDYPGIWPRTLGAATQLGFEAYIERFRTWDDVRRAVAENKVILASMRVPRGLGYIAPPYWSLGGHIVAINGVTADGRVIVTDSALGKDGRGFRCQWLQSDFEKVWMDVKGGVGMVICPPAHAQMKTVDALEPFPRGDRPAEGTGIGI